MNKIKTWYQEHKEQVLTGTAIVALVVLTYVAFKYDPSPKEIEESESEPVDWDAELAELEQMENEETERMIADGSIYNFLDTWVTDPKVRQDFLTAHSLEEKNNA